MRQFIEHTLKRFSNVHNQDGVLPNALIISTPRSGSTWLMELIWSQPGFKICNEPLNIRRKEIAGTLGMNTFSKLYDDSNKAEILNYFSVINNGGHGFLNPSPLRKYHRFRTNRIAYKVINAGEDMVDDIAGVTQSKVIYLIRHPFTVSLSRKVLPRLEVLSADPMLERMGMEDKDLVNEVLQNGTYLEKAVLAWCLENKLALHYKKNDWIIFTYEQLVVDPVPVIELLARELNLPLTDRMIEGLNVPSAVTVQSESGTSGQIRSVARNQLVSKWKERISEEQAVHLWRIVDAFGLDIYNKDSSLPVKAYTIC